MVMLGNKRLISINEDELLKEDEPINVKKIPSWMKFNSIYFFNYE